MSRKSRTNKAEQQAALAIAPQPEPTEAGQPVIDTTEIETPTEPMPDSIPAEQDYFCCDPIEQPAPRSGSVIKAAYKKTHVLDALAQAVSDTVRSDGKVDDALFLALCEANGIDASRWAHLNVGMQVMALTNVLRARERKGEEPVVLTLEQAEEEATEAA